jgi:hypothetical protein
LCLQLQINRVLSVGASLLAKNQQTQRGIRHPALLLTTIATVRRFDRLAPTGGLRRAQKLRRASKPVGARLARDDVGTNNMLAA